MNTATHAFQFKPATKASAKLRAALFGPSGSGKTFSALRIASGLGGRIAVIDTERGSASKYADRFRFDVLDLADKSIQAYQAAIQAAAQAAYEVLVIDSLSHGWQELLSEVDRLASSKYKGNTWGAWSEGTPKQRALVDAILVFPGHVLATMRSKTEWSTDTGSNGKSRPVRIGLAPEQGKGIEYEFDLLLEISPDHIANVIKDRSGRFQDALLDKPGEDFGRDLAAWLSDAPEDAPAHPPKLISDTQHRRLEALLKDAGIPRERMKSWVATKYQQAYQGDVHLDKLLDVHMAEIEQRIPAFAKKITEEAMEWVTQQYALDGSDNRLREIVSDVQRRAKAAAKRPGEESRSEAQMLSSYATVLSNHIDATVGGQE